jgi:predicted regulator of Ras-like GTPase activity (Roadblock/LC7/MglB family)
MTLKIGFLGLDAAGKTAFLTALSKMYASMINPMPTKGIERSKKDLEGLSLVFYLVDIQDLDRLEESASYLSNLLEKMDDFDQDNLIICFHKYDPERRDALKDQLNTAWTKMEGIAEDAWAFLPTSIFDENSILQAFSTGLRKAAVKEDIIRIELRKIQETAGARGAVVLNSEGYVIASQAPNEVIAEEMDAVGISLASLWHSARGAFEEIVGKHSLGDFRFDRITVDGKDYFVLVIGTQDRAILEKIQSVLETIS